MDEPNVEETSRAQRRWEGMIRVSRSRSDSGTSSARVQQLAAEPPQGLPDQPPRVPSAVQVRAGGRRWQPEPADWTSTVFGIELPHEADCPLHDVEPPERQDVLDEQHAELDAVAGETAEPAVADPPAEPAAEVRPMLALPPGPAEAPEAPDPVADEVIDGIVLLPVAADDTMPVELEPDELELVRLAADERPVIDAADLDLVAVQLEELAEGLSNCVDDRYTELPVIVPPRHSGWQSPIQPRLPASRRESDPIGPTIGIGATLAAARESAGLTHEQVARMTRIGVARLVEFENDDYSGCGADIFARGRLDSIARAVGVDPEPLLEEFDARFGGVHTVTYPVGWTRPQIRMPRNWTMVLLCALAVAGIYPVALLVAGVLG